MKKLSVVAAAFVAVVGSLNAGGKLVELPQVPPIPVVTDNWSGPYVGVQAGFITGKATVTVKQYDLPGENYLVRTFVPLTLEPDGFIGGVFVGYNKKFDNNFLVGIEGALNYTNIKDAKDLEILKDPVLKQNNEAALYLRAGYVKDDKIMPYILGGVTWTKLKGGLEMYNNPMIWDSDSVTGWTVGAGLEYKINKKWHVRAQYRFSKYKEAKFKWENPPLYFRGETDKYKTHSIMVGVSYHFN
jgi:outer membrane immunogenic protein